MTYYLVFFRSELIIASIENIFLFTEINIDDKIKNCDAAYINRNSSFPSKSPLNVVSENHNPVLATLCRLFKSAICINKMSIQKQPDTSFLAFSIPKYYSAIFFIEHNTRVTYQ